MSKYISFKTGLEVFVDNKHYDFNLNMANIISTQSKDQGTKVGCVVTDNNFVIISTGYNGPNRSADDSEYNFSREPKKYFFYREYKHLGLTDTFFMVKKNPYMIHAEMNAIVNCTNRNAMKDSIVFVTHYCCTNCLNTLIQAGVKRIVVDNKAHSAFQETLSELIFLVENSRLHDDFLLIRIEE